MSSMAHNTQQASFRLQLDGVNSGLDIILSQHGIEQALLPLKNSSVKLDKNNIQLKEAIVKHLKENISLTVNNQSLEIGGGLIKLGSHQSIVRFKIKNVPEAPKQLIARIRCFEQNQRQENILSVFFRSEKARFSLNHRNDFSIQVPLFVKTETISN